MKRLALWTLLSLIILAMFSGCSPQTKAQESPDVGIRALTSKDVLVVNDPFRRAFFGWYQASEMPVTGWDLLNRTVLWAAGNMFRNQTRIVFFSNMDPADDSALVHAWLISNGFDELLVEQRNYNDTEGIPASYYDNFDLVIYWNVTAYDSSSIVASEIPFITVSAGQTDEMGIGTGVATMHASNDTFYIVNMDHYPTYTYPGGPFIFENEVAFETIETTGGGRVLIKAEVESVSPTLEMSNTQGVTVLPDGNATMSFSIYVPDSPLADIYREHFFSDVSSLQGDVEYEIPENKTLQVTVEVEEGALDVSLPGDINGDGKADIFDIVEAAGAYGTLVEDERFDFQADVKCDGKIDIFDIVTMAAHYGKTRESTGNLCVVGYYNGTEVNCTDVFYVGPQGASQPRNVSACGYTWFGLHPGLYNVYGTHNGSSTTAVGNVTQQENCHAQLDFGGTESPPTPTPYIPVKDDFCKAIADEQYALLGFNTTVTESKITPLTTNGSLVISLTAYSPQLAEFISFWRIPVGPRDESTLNNSVNFLYWKIQFLQMMLQKLSGEQVYESDWKIEFTLPSSASLLNGGEIHGLNWTVNLGGGSSLDANVTLDTTSVDPRIYLYETMVITEQNITISEEDFTDAITEYKVFNIDYSQAGGRRSSATASIPSPRINLRYSSFVKDFRFTLPVPSFSKTWQKGPVTAAVQVYPQLSIRWRISGRWDWWLRCLQRFGTWITVYPSIKARGWAYANSSATKAFGPATLASITLTRWGFAIGPVPVWARLRLSVHVKTRVEADGKVGASVYGAAGGWFKTGVHWHRGSGFDPYWNQSVDAEAELFGAVDTNLKIVPSASLRLALLFYDIAGPFVEGETYTPLVISFPPGGIESFKLKFRVNYGVTYAGWLKDLAGLKDWTREIAHWTIWTFI